MEENKDIEMSKGSSTNEEDLGTQEDVNRETSPIDGDNSPDVTRTKLASYYLWGFFIVIGSCFLFAFIRSTCECSIRDLKDLLLTASGILSGPLGFVFGYYFKNGEK